MSRIRRLPTVLVDSESFAQEVRLLLSRGRLTQHEYDVLYFAVIVRRAEDNSLKRIASMVRRETGAARLLTDLDPLSRVRFTENEIRTLLRRGVTILRQEGLVSGE